MTKLELAKCDKRDRATGLDGRHSGAAVKTGNHLIPAAKSDPKGFVKTHPACSSIFFN